MFLLNLDAGKTSSSAAWKKVVPVVLVEALHDRSHGHGVDLLLSVLGLGFLAGPVVKPDKLKAVAHTTHRTITNKFRTTKWR